MSADEPANACVAVLAASGDLYAAERIARGLANVGLSPRVNPVDELPERAVVLISAAASGDLDWRAAVERSEYARLVPVRIGAVEAAAMPGIVAALNWITWTEADAPVALGEVFAALHSDMSRYRIHRRLASAAATWDSAGRPSDLLIGEREAVERAYRHLTDAEHDTLAHPTALIREFVQLSRQSTTIKRSNRNRRWLLRMAATGMAMVVVVAAFTVIRAAAKTNNLQFLGTMPWTISARPDRVAMLSAGLVLQASEAQKPLARQTALAALAQPWSSGLLGAVHKSRIGPAALDRDGRRTLTLDGDGELSVWDNATLTPIWHHLIGGVQGPGDMDVNSDLSIAAVVTGQALHMISREPWDDRVVRLPEPAIGVALAPAQRVVVVSTEAGDLRTASFDSGGFVSTLHFDSVLELRQTVDGGVRALVRVGTGLVVVDPLTNTRSDPVPFPGYRFELGALAPDGRGIAAVGADRQLYYTSDTTVLRPTGQAVPDLLNVLAVLSDGRIAFGGGEFGIRVFDTRAGVPVGELCKSTTPVLQVRAAEDGNMIACLDYFVVDLWRSRDLGPLPAAPASIIAMSTKPSMTGGALTAMGDDQGRLDVTDGHTSRSHKVSRDAITVVSVNSAARSVLVGTAAGTVFQYAFTDPTATLVGLWTAPDGGAVAELGWSADGARLLVRTRRGLWWSPRSCDGCDHDAVLVDRVRDRLWGCFTGNQVEFLSAASRKRLGIQVCAPGVGE